ncbi:hypothetical protein GCM10023310_72120 [Paenibacillus vulneris]|uniref:Uncharacterized protein n=1 Tax=Paenibacillus vulneris TaxID=1133364 RepID=A0ABW3UIL2_9BACL
MNDHSICQVQIEALKEDITEFKRDVREHLKEVKESHKIYTETISVLKENVIRLTSIAERQDEKLDAINKDIAFLKQNKPVEQPKTTETNWYQKMLENKEKYFMYVLLVLLAFSLGLKVETLTGFLGGK